MVVSGQPAVCSGNAFVAEAINVEHVVEITKETQLTNTNKTMVYK